MSDREDQLAAAADGIRAGGTVVYPTETVYGLGADATDPEAVGRVFEVKRRAREKPLSMGVPDVDAALSYTTPTPAEVRFMREFLPGPVTVVVERGEAVPDELVAGRDRVGVRVPDHEVALDLFRRVAPTPVTATSANRSGRPSVTHPDQLDPDLRASVAAVVDAGETPGTESTVVDPGRGEILRRGARADEVAAWLEAHADELGFE
jgi:L-threonylcarbamoyladenylate synthase